MAQVPKELIEEATRRGIVEGATVKSAGMGYRFVVTPSHEWEFDPGGNVHSKFSIYDAEKTKWATVIAPAPSKGLQEGDAVECSPAMRAAIIELAKELGVCNGQDGGIRGESHGVWNCHGTGLVNTISNFQGTTKITPEEFIARMRVTASTKANKDCSFRLSYEKGAVKIGDVLLSNDVYRSIAKGLQD